MWTKLIFNSDPTLVIHNQASDTLTSGEQVYKTPNSIGFKAPSWLSNAALYTMLSLGTYAMMSCEKDKTVDPTGQVELKFKEYSKKIEWENVVLILPNWSKINVGGVIILDIRENISTWIRDVSINFKWSDLLNVLRESLKKMKESYPNASIVSLNLWLFKLNWNISSNWTNTIEFIEIHNSSVAAIWLDKLNPNLAYKWSDLDLIAWWNWQVNNTTSVAKDEKIQLSIWGFVKSPGDNFTWYIPSNKISLDI